MDVLPMPDENTPLWQFRVGVDFMVSARDMSEARALVGLTLDAEDSDGSPFVKRHHRVVEGGLPWGVSEWQAVPPRPSQAALVQEHYPGMVADLAIVEALRELLQSATVIERVPAQTLDRIRQALFETNPEIAVEDPELPGGRRVFEGSAIDAADHLAEGVYRAFDIDDREYALIVAPSELTPSGRLSAAFPKERHEARTLDEISVLLRKHTREQPLPELVRLISRRVNTTRRAGLPSWVPLDGEPERLPTPPHVNIGVINWSDLEQDEPTVLAHSNPVTLARQIATMLHETLSDSDAFAGATEFLSSHSTPADWQSPEDVDRWMDALREATPLPSFSLQRIPVTGIAAAPTGHEPLSSSAAQDVRARQGEVAPVVTGEALWSYRVPVDFDVSARTPTEARRLVDEALEGDAPGGIAVVQQRQQVLADGDVFGVLGWHHPDRPAASDPVRAVLEERATQLDTPGSSAGGPDMGSPGRDGHAPR